ncbi:hypothetical protein [Fluviispira multicolorata]|uniref:C2H2-type domain-containing protein n=1 Tax=Fluviispira multicolorata TaxID=2654512 RepID=A0A833JEQ5_9BACT|nr:hypothetical protein [Fluviispira multicolorata]KAB8033331.1 hypothetical protein GCL57_01130 [Fluviispira multicolorata]
MVVENIQLLLRAKSKSSSPTMQRVCRVLKGPDCYICGLCGRRYKKLKDAWKCVTIGGLKIKSHLIASSNSFAHNYQCILCGKAYANQQDTSICTIRDVENGWFPRILSEHLLSMAYSMLNSDPKTRRNLLSTRQRGGITSVSEADNQSLSKKATEMNDSLDDDEDSSPPPSPEKSFDSLENESTEIKAQAPQLEQMPETEPATGEPMDHDTVYYEKPAEKDKPVHFRTPGQKPFIRNGSNYVCSVCNEKFFTKMEAENHFNEHPLVETV